jgi:hypothetical protein
VNKRRRQEAHKFFKNFEKIVELKLINKHGSLGRLLTEFDSIVNPKVKTPAEPKVETPVLAIEDKSNEVVTQSTKTVEDLALDVLLQVEANGFKVSDFKVAIANAIGMIEDNNEVIPFEMVG